MEQKWYRRREVLTDHVERATAKTIYTQNLEVYVGKQPNGPYCVENDASSIVDRLVTPISGTGRNVTCIN